MNFILHMKKIEAPESALNHMYLLQKVHYSQWNMQFQVFFLEKM